MTLQIIEYLFDLIVIQCKQRIFLIKKVLLSPSVIRNYSKMKQVQKRNIFGMRKTRRIIIFAHLILSNPKTLEIVLRKDKNWSSRERQILSRRMITAMLLLLSSIKLI